MIDPTTTVAPEAISTTPKAVLDCNQPTSFLYPTYARNSPPPMATAPMILLLMLGLPFYLSAA